MRRSLIRAEGFSLAEVALSLAIIAAVIGVLVPSLLTLRASEQARATQQNLEAVMRASAAFVQANGCLPCPSPASSLTTAGLGVVRGDASANPAACAGCSAATGLVPFRSLGLPADLARDGYGHWLTFAVDISLTQNFGIVPPASACQASDTPCDPQGGTNTCSSGNPPCSTADINNGTRKKGLCRANLSATGNPLQVMLASGGTQPAAILALSHGANGRGAFAEAGSSATRMPFPSSAPSCSPGSSGPERCNADDDSVFVAATPGTGTDPFDDQMLYLDRNALVASLGGPGCQSAW